MPNDNVIENFDFDKLAGSNEVAGNLDVRFGRSRLAARMVVLCEPPSYVQAPELAFVRPRSSSLMRTLKIEPDGDRWKGIKPKIRLTGRWLERAGFKPGERVSVTCVAPGFIELRSPAPPAAGTSARPLDEASNCPF